MRLALASRQVVCDGEPLQGESLHGLDAVCNHAPVVALAHANQEEVAAFSAPHTSERAASGHGVASLQRRGYSAQCARARR
eukprot:3983776-Prymnesium_polylepis.2